jgi:hypothetical protein
MDRFDLIFIVVSVCGLPLLALIAAAFRFPSILGLATALAVSITVGFGIALRAVAGIERSEITRRMIASLLILGRCPACGHSLRGVPAGDNSLTRCPECSAAWENVALAATLGDTQV